MPHFSRLGDVEVNAGQNATFQCIATGKTAESEPYLLEVSGGGEVLCLDREEWNIKSRLG